MKKYSEIESHRINGKMIYILDDHKYALIPWVKIKRKCKKDVVLISLTNNIAIQSPATDLKLTEDEIEHRLSQVDINDDESLYSLINELNESEYLKVALYKDIISKAFIINMACKADYPKSDQEREIEERINNRDINYLMKIIDGKIPPCRRNERTFPKSDIYMPCFIPEDRIISNGKYEDYAIEDVFIKDKFEVFSRMCPEIIDSNGEVNCKYVLDIDSSYFHSKKSLRPESCSIFNNLVKNASAITISKNVTNHDKSVISNDVNISEIREVIYNIL